MIVPLLYRYLLILHLLVAVGLGRVAADLPANLARVCNTAVGTLAFKGIVRLLGAVGPRFEQSDVAISTASTRAKGANKVTFLEIVPLDGLCNIREADGAEAWGRCMESHANEARAVGAVFAATGVGVVGAHGVWDVARDPVISTLEDLLAADLALVGGAATVGAAVAVLGDHAIRAGVDVEVGDVAAVVGLVPDGVALDVFAIGLAGDVDILAVVVSSDRGIAGRGTLATVEAIGGDFVCVGDRERRSEGHKQVGELHGE